MIATPARRWRAHPATWADNIAVKLPVTAAGLDVLEECGRRHHRYRNGSELHGAAGRRVAERHCRGAGRRAAGIKPGRCFSVIMIGRLDDYLREVAQDNRAAVSEEDIRQAGLAVTKAYAIYQEQGYEAVLLVAALRGNYQDDPGGDLIMSVHIRRTRAGASSSRACCARCVSTTPCRLRDRPAVHPARVQLRARA